MKFKCILAIPFTILAIIVLVSEANPHDGDHHEEKSHKDRILFDEGSGSSSLGEYEKKLAKPSYKEDESVRRQGQISSSTAPKHMEEGDHSYEYEKHSSPKFKKEYKGEGSSGKNKFPSN